MKKQNSDIRPREDSRSRFRLSRRSVLSAVGLAGVGALSQPAAARLSSGGVGGDFAAGPDGVTDDPHEEGEHRLRTDRQDPSQPLIDLDAEQSSIVSEGPSAKVTKNLAVAGRGERLIPNGTTDVWAYDGYAYVGTFNSPCGSGAGYVSDVGEVDLNDDLEGPGIAVFDVSNNNKSEHVGNIPSVAGSRTNDVKVAEMNSGVVLAHTNESCGGGPGGFEIYNVDDPLVPVHLASVQTDDANPLYRDVGVTDVGVHNVWLFSQGERDYIAAVVESVFGNCQIFDITDPANPTFVSAWGAELLTCGDDCSDELYADQFDPANFGLLFDGEAYVFGGVGTSQNRFLHDVTVSEDGTKAYLANWDAGLVLLDISDPANPALISQAIAPSVGDGEVNSHQAWPTADGSVIVETDEDFDPFNLTFEVTGGSNAGEYPVSEGAITEPIVDLPNGTLSGPTVYVGLACNAASVPAATQPGQIAVIQRGVCAFTTKIDNADAAGYQGVIVFNDEARGDALVTMGGDPVGLPGVFVGHSTGLAILGVSDASALTVGASGAPVEVVSGYGRWGNVRIWDYADEANPKLASQFDTVCSAHPDDDSCDPRGTYSVHNVVVEGDKVYISWYSDGVLVVDISDPYKPVEVARYNETGSDFEMANGGIQDVWGIYKEPNMPWIYASDRNGGLYVLKELGSGSGKQGRDGRGRGKS